VQCNQSEKENSCESTQLVSEESYTPLVDSKTACVINAMLAQS